MIRDYPLSASTSSTSAATSSSTAADSPFPTSIALDSPSLSAQLSSSTSSSFFAPEGSNSVTARQRPLPPPPNGSAREEKEGASGADDNAQRAAAEAEREAWRLSEARLRLRRQVDEMPRVGALLTLDVKGNDLRVRFLPSIFSSLSFRLRVEGC
jgi:protein phosphatase 1 regulatory subunit 37